MKTLNFSVKLILILLVLGAISFTSCKKEASKEDTAKKEEQVTKKRNGDEFIGQWIMYERYPDEICEIYKSGDLFILEYYDNGDFGKTSYPDKCNAYYYSDGVLTGNDKIFFNSKKNCIYFNGDRYQARGK